MSAEEFKWQTAQVVGNILISAFGPVSRSREDRKITLPDGRVVYPPSANPLPDPNSDDAWFIIHMWEGNQPRAFEIIVREMPS